MAWVLIVASLLLLLWLASLTLCKFLHAPTSPLLTTAGGGLFSQFQERNILLVVAHPDDESMFFSPTISYLTSRGHNLHILCLSIGDADGKGNVRKEELYQACAILKVPLQQVKTLDHPDLQIITFDSYGVSGHCNHRDVHYGVRHYLYGNEVIFELNVIGMSKLLRDTSQGNIEAWELVSTNILRKYIGPVDIWLSILDAMRHSGEVMHCLLNEHPQKSFLAMAQHSSQWVC
uniref:N-acetylglucosaminylphosphatidylinositol deacetylase n=1 Tax=Fagus sylvatica TaxID=28930 RepID=A0A2N9HB49_FAGSY